MRIFLGEPDRGRAHTYGQVAGAVAGFRGRLRRSAAARGDRVAILSDNSLGWVVAYLGTIAHGAIAVPLNTRHATGDLDPALDDFEPAAIVGYPAHLGRLSGRYRGRAIGGGELRETERLAPMLDGSEARPDEIGILCYTSGTTGEPRRVMIRNESLVRNAAMFAQLFQSGPDSATAVACPLFHNTGYNDGLAHMLLVGGRVDVPRRFEPGTIARSLAEARYPFLKVLRRRDGHRRGAHAALPLHSRPHRVGVRGVVGRGDHPRLGVARCRVAPDVPGVRPRPRRQARRRHGAWGQALTLIHLVAPQGGGS